MTPIAEPTHPTDDKIQQRIILVIKFTAAFLAMLYFAGLFQRWFYPWWTFVFGTFLVGATVLKYHPNAAFNIGFLAMFTQWFYNISIADTNNRQILSERLSTLLGVPEIVIMLVCAVWAAILGGVSARAGHYFRGMIRTYLAQKNSTHSPTSQSEE
jgi:uncharacterized membrane protein AbrB (regulator of aidB expression)